MSDTNSIRFETRRPYAGSLWAWGHRFTPHQAEQLREFLQAKRDEELGRTPDTVDKDIYIYRTGPDRIQVLDESIPYVGTLDRAFVEECQANDYDPRMHLFPAAARYFDTHPEPKPVPWAAAKESDIWALELRDYPGVFAPYQVTIDTDGETVMGPRFFPILGGAQQPGFFPREFLSGHRIWPEPEGDPQ